MKQNLLQAALAASLMLSGAQAAFAVNLSDLKPNTLPSMSRPDLTKPLPPPLRVQPQPQVSIGHGNAFGVAPTLNIPMRNGGQVEIKGPDFHPRVPPSLNGGAVTITVPLPEGKK